MSARRGIFLVLTLITLAVMASVGGLLVWSAFVGGRGAVPTVPSSAALSLRIEAPFSEIDPPDVFGQFFETAPTLRSTVGLIRRAKTDARVKVLVLRPVAAGALWAQVQEVRAAIEDFKTSGKPVVAFLEAAGTGEYYLASAANRIVLMPAGQIDLTGVASHELFFRGALDKMGIVPDMLHIGDYKTASNTFTERTFTPEHREMTRVLNRDWYDEVVRAIAAGRKISEDAARAAIDGGPYLAQEALEAGLVDELKYEDQLDDAAPVQGTLPMDSDGYVRAALSTRAATGRRVAVLYAVGTIASGESSFDSPTGTVLGSDTFVQWVRKVRVDPNIAAVVVRIDSPGGSAIASEVMWRELMLTRDVKPLVVSMGDVAASGGYYIAAPAHTIFAQPGTLTGSIGVVTGKFVLSGGLEKWGIGTGSISDGRSAEIYSPFKPFSPEERTKVETQMRSIYTLFLDRVAEGRKQNASAIDAVAQGRVWSGHRARELGLVDELGGLDAAIRAAAEKARLDLANEIRVEVYPAKRSIFDLVSGRMSTTTGASLGQIFARPEARAVDSALSLAQLFRRGEPLAIMPNVFVK